MADKKSSPKKETPQDKTYAIVEASGQQFWLQPNRYYDLDRCQAEIDDVLLKRKQKLKLKLKKKQKRK